MNHPNSRPLNQSQSPRPSTPSMTSAASAPTIRYSARPVTTKPTNPVHPTTSSVNGHQQSTPTSTLDVISQITRPETQRATESPPNAPAPTTNPTHLTTNGASTIELSESESITTTEDSTVITEINTQATTQIAGVFSRLKESFGAGGKNRDSGAGKLAESLWSFVLSDLWPIIEAEITEQMKTVTSKVTTSTNKMTQEKYEKRLKELKSKYEKEQKDIRLEAANAIRASWAEYDRLVKGMEKSFRIRVSVVKVPESDETHNRYLKSVMGELTELRDDAPHRYDAKVSVEGIEIRSHD